MSGRRRPRPDPLEQARQKHAARCGHCDSSVIVRDDPDRPGLRRTTVVHADACPTSRGTEIELTRAPGQSVEEFRAYAREFTARLAEQYGPLNLLITDPVGEDDQDERDR